MNVLDTDASESDDVAVSVPSFYRIRKSSIRKALKIISSVDVTEKCSCVCTFISRNLLVDKNNIRVALRINDTLFKQCDK